MYVNCEIAVREETPSQLQPVSGRWFVSSGVDIGQVELAQHKLVTREDCVPCFFRLSFEVRRQGRYLAGNDCDWISRCGCERLVHMQPQWREILKTPQCEKNNAEYTVAMIPIERAPDIVHEF
jgi:hypothetical protein